LIRSHFETILGPNSDFMHVVLYESRYLNAMQHKVIAKLQGEYEATWTSVLQELSLTGCLQVEVPVARHLIFGVLNGSAQWFKSEMGISIDDLTDAVVALCIHVPPAKPDLMLNAPLGVRRCIRTTPTPWPICPARPNS
ncbi:MAG: hypothetical protein Q8N06_06380, partial [Hydrogenophaga sp.]|nr:hypothetical protein [Hydrogenophaga sp.]